MLAPTPGLDTETTAGNLSAFTDITSSKGEILAVGPGKKNDKGDLVAVGVKVGERVLFGKYSGQTVKVDGEELLVMKEEDLFAVVDSK